MANPISKFLLTTLFVVGTAVTNANADKWSLYTYAPSLKLPSAAAMDKLAAEMSDKTNGEV